ncbi:DUF554 family protein [Treponema sp. R8-4-B8]
MTMSIVFGATFGIGAAFSALPLLLYQGGIALASAFIGATLCGIPVHLQVVRRLFNVCEVFSKKSKIIVKI